MEMYNAPKHGIDENYMIQSMEPSVQLTSPFEQVGAMYNEGATEFVVDQGLLYTAATGYGYYCTGFDSPGEWEDHHRIFGVDGPDIHYTGSQNESFPYVYYTPTYGYAQSPYNPYNPYIPGAMIGVDGPQYYSVSPYQNAVSSAAYIPFVLQPDTIPSNPPESLFGTGTSINRFDGQVSRNNFNSTSGAFPNSTKSIPNTKGPSSMMSRGSKSSVGPSKEAATKGSNPAGGFPSPASTNVLQGRNSFGSIQAVASLPNGQISAHHNQMKVRIPSSCGLSDFGPSNHGRPTVAKLRPKVPVGNGPDSLGEQNQGPGVNQPKNELAVKAYTTRAGGTNGQGNIIIYTDQYNKDGFPVEHTDAKFFVIKSYSEDDVHKSIKYNVWSSTPHGNKKLSSAFEDAQRIAARKPGGCPIFLFFSVNVSGQFCGVAEMIGPVDFNRDMDFWQQDKWNGSFPVKWHIIKDVPNTSLRHIILENNENKPVTNSRDTQEIMYEKGIEMLKFFKNYASRTSLFDDFMYYESRQKTMLEDKARLHGRSYESPFVVPASGPPRKLNCVVEVPPIPNNKHNDANKSKKTGISATEQTDITNSNVRHEQTGVETEYDVSSLKVATLSINPKSSDYISSVDTSFGTDTEPFDLKVGSVPLKLNGSSESSGFLTIGTIPIDPKSLLFEKGKGVAAAKKGSQQK